MADYQNVALPAAVYNAIKEAKPPGMSYWGYIVSEMELEVDPDDL